MPRGYGFSEEVDSNASAGYNFMDELTLSGNRVARTFRLVPDEPVLDPLIESFALACSQIPTLAIAVLATHFTEKAWNDADTKCCISEWGIYFAAEGSESNWYCPGAFPNYPEEDLTIARLSFNTRRWRPNEKLCKILRGIGGYGEKLEEKYVDLWESIEKPAEVKRMEQRRLAQAANVDAQLDYIEV